MPKLLLLRHAKSSWKRSELADIDRPLSARGRRDAPRMAARLVADGHLPDLILCSAARRTRDTWELVTPELGRDTPACIEPALYLADAPAILRRIRDVDAATRTLLVIGHNPGLEELAKLLIRDAGADPARRLHEKFPTAAVAVIGFDGEWAGLGPGTGELHAFIRPRDL